MDYNKTAELIQNARKEKGLTQRELADILGVTDRAVSKWERAKSFPDVSMLQPLAEVLDISVTEILDGERRSNDAAVTAGEAEQAAIRGIDSYVRDTRKKNKPLWGALAIVLLILGAVAFYEYDEYRHRPLKFQEDELEFEAIIYLDEEGQKHEFELKDGNGQEVRAQITEFLKNRVSQSNEITRNPEVRKSMPRVELEGLVTFYFDCYYDYRSEKFYTFSSIDNLYRKMQVFCEDLVSDETYEYAGPTYWEKGGKYFYIACELTEKPMELILRRYIDAVNSYNPEVRPGYYRSCIIENIKRLTPEEYKTESDYEYWFSKEIPYREIYCYRIYEVEIRFVDSDLYRGSGAQFPEGRHKFCFMAAKSRYDSNFEVIDQYIGPLQCIERAE